MPSKVATDKKRSIQKGRKYENLTSIRYTIFELPTENKRKILNKNENLAQTHIEQITSSEQRENRMMERRRGNI